MVEEKTLSSRLIFEGRAVKLRIDTVETAIDMIKKYKIKKLPVIMDDKIVGIVTVTDISKARPDISRRFMESWVKPRWRD